MRVHDGTETIGAFVNLPGKSIKRLTWSDLKGPTLSKLRVLLSYLWTKYTQGEWPLSFELLYEGDQS